MVLIHSLKTTIAAKSEENLLPQSGVFMLIVSTRLPSAIKGAPASLSQTPSDYGCLSVRNFEATFCFGILTLAVGGADILESSFRKMFNPGLL